MEWYWIVLIVVWALPVGFFAFAAAFVDGEFFASIPFAMLWPLWLPVIAASEFIDSLRR